MKGFIKLLIIFIFTGCASKTSMPVVSKPTKKIAIMLPLSNEFESQGNKLLSLIKTGLEQAGYNSPPKVYDCTSSEQAMQAINDIAAQKFHLVIGPLFAETTSLIQKKAEEKNIILLSLSNDPKLTENFRNTYILGERPSKQMEALVDYFASQDSHNYIVFMPGATMSNKVANILENIIKHKQASLDRKFYPCFEHEIEAHVKQLSADIDKLNEDEDALKPVLYVHDIPANLALVFKEFKKYNIFNKAYVIGDHTINIDPNDEEIKIYYTGKMEKKLESLDPSMLSNIELVGYDAGFIAGTIIKPANISEQLNNKTYNGIMNIISFKNNIAARKYPITHRIGKNLQVIE